MSSLNKIFVWYQKIIQGLLVLGIVSLIIIGMLGIVFRWMGQSPLWIDPLVRHLVLLVAFLGATLASGSLQHIKIDVFSHFIDKSPAWIKILIERWVQLVTTIITGYLSYASYQFFLIEKEYPQPSFLGLESHHLVFIIPFGFFLVTLMSFLKLCFLEVKSSGQP